MPELPEVETVVCDLKTAGLVGLRVTNARIAWKRSIASPTPVRFVREIRGLQIHNLSRRGKFIVAALSGGFTLLIHLRMSGRLEMVRPGEDKRHRRHDRVILALDDGSELRFADPRKFGRIWLVKNPARILGKLGPEPLGLSATEFSRQMGARSRILKPLLLDQAIIAGIGNIYSDEALWTARLHPQRKSNSLSAAETRNLLTAIRQVLRRGIRNLGTTLGAGKTHFKLPRGGSGHNQAQLAAYGQTGKPCPRCGAKIVRILVGQRATHFCPTCQRRKRHTPAKEVHIEKSES